MAVYEISTRTTVTTATALTPIAAFRASTTQRAGVREISLFNVTAPTTSGGVGLMRSTATGTASASVSAIFQREPGANAAGSGGTAAFLATAWSAAPTVGVANTVFKRWHHNISLGNGIVWTFDLTAPLIVPLGSSATGELVLVNLQATTAATYEINVVWEE